VHWVVELDVKAGAFDAFRALASELVAATEMESGTLAYEYTFTADRSRCHIYERYVDSAAAIAHLGMFGDRFATRFAALVTPTRFVVYGPATAALKDALAAFDPLYLETLAGFCRC
jgi:quinol monooxygenase YgiN